MLGRASGQIENLPRVIDAVPPPNERAATAAQLRAPRSSTAATLQRLPVDGPSIAVDPNSPAGMHLSDAKITEEQGHYLVRSRFRIHPWNPWTSLTWSNENGLGMWVGQAALLGLGLQMVGNGAEISSEELVTLKFIACRLSGFEATYVAAGAAPPPRPIHAH